MIMLLMLDAEKTAEEHGDIVRAAEIRAEYLLLIDGFYDDVFNLSVSEVIQANKSLITCKSL